MSPFVRGLPSFLLVLAACVAEEPPAGPPVELDVAFEQSALPNGLAVVVVPNHTAPVVMGLLSVRTGAFSERRELSGYSHLFEHMIFKGSVELADPVAFRNQLEQLGAVTNATTSVDAVNYFFTTQREHAEAALGVYASALIGPAFDAAELEKEKQVVLAEFDLKESDPGYELYRRMLRELYGQEAHRLNALGAREVVEAVTSEQLRAAHARWYVPDNALLVLSGDLTPAQGKAWATKHFGRWSKGKPSTEAALAPLAPLAASRHVVLAADVSETTLWMAWPAHGADADNEAAWAAALLGELSLQRDHPFRSLVGRDLASSGRLRSVSYGGAGYFLAELRVPFGNEQKVLQALHAVIDELGDYRDSDLDEARNALWRSRFEGLTDPLALPFWVASDWQPNEPFESIDAGRVYEVGRGALERFVREQLSGRPHVTLLMSSAVNLVTQGIDAEWLEEQQ